MERLDTTADLQAASTGLVTEVMHPLVQHKLGLLRDTTTTTQMFRQLVNELTLLLTYEATKDLANEEIEIETPLELTTARRISGRRSPSSRFCARALECSTRYSRSFRAHGSASSGPSVTRRHSSRSNTS